MIPVNSASSSSSFLLTCRRNILGSPAALQLNLPVVQWHIAMGVALDRIPDIRRLYGRNAVVDGDDNDKIDFMQEEYCLSSSAIDKKLEVDKSSQVVVSLEKEIEALKRKIDIMETQRIDFKLPFPGTKRLLCSKHHL